MNDMRNVDRELDELEPGATRVLTAEGWEESAYIEPAGDWEVLEDGSWVSPDGQIRTWPDTGPGDA